MARLKCEPDNCEIAKMCGPDFAALAEKHVIAVLGVEKTHSAIGMATIATLMHAAAQWVHILHSASDAADQVDALKAKTRNIRSN